MKYSKYPSYKDSGVEWLGSLPVDWKKLPIKYIGKLNAGAGFPHSEQGNESKELPFYKVNALAKSDINDYLTNKENTVSEATAKQLGAFIFPIDSIVFAKVGAALLLSRIRWVKFRSCLDNNMMGLVVNNKNFTKFIKYAMNTIKFDYLVNPGAIPSLNESQIGNFYLAIPPLQEQKAIATYLDRATQKIDTLIAKQSSLIALLKEKRQALISHAVTKGLNPNAKMKESGVAWLGEIPEGWEVVQSRRLFQERKGRALKDDEQLTASQKYGVIPQKKFMKIEGRKVTQVLTGSEILKHVEANDFVMSMRSFQGGLEYSAYTGCVSSAYVGLIPIKHVNSTFFRYLFKSKPYIQALQSTSNLVRDGQALRFDNFSKVSLVIVPDKEQKAIATYLDQKTQKIDTLITKATDAITLLKEKRTALISAVVTGKVDVRREIV